MWTFQKTSFGNLDENFTNVRAQYHRFNRKKDLIIKEKYKLDNVGTQRKSINNSDSQNNKCSNFLNSQKFNQSKDNLVNIKNYKNLNLNYILSSVAFDNRLMSEFLKKLSKKKKKLKLKSINKVPTNYHNTINTNEINIKTAELFKKKISRNKQRNNDKPSFISKSQNCYKKNLTSSNFTPFNITNRINSNTYFINGKKNPFNTQRQKFNTKDLLSQISRNGTKTLDDAYHLRNNIEETNKYYLKTFQNINNSDDGEYVIIGGEKIKEDLTHRKKDKNYYDKYYKNFKCIKDIEKNILKNNSNIYNSVKIKLFNKYQNRVKKKDYASDIISVEEM